MLAQDVLFFWRERAYTYGVINPIEKEAREIQRSEKIKVAITAR